MSVLAVNRKESRFEAIAFSIDLHDMLIELMQRGFGVRDVDRFVRRRFVRGTITEETYAFYRNQMHSSKMRIDQLASLLTNNIRAANSIYPTDMPEYEMRREYQNMAIVACEQIVHELQRIVDIFEVDVNVYGRYIQAIDREIGLIKRWRQRDNRIKDRLLGST